MNFTEEQLSAIKTSGNNIIVSAGAGSGKTAVLSERVIEKLKNNINIDSLLILTFTSNAAIEMKERIRKKIIKNNLKEQLDLLDNAYITTFDSYALSIVKKYGYLLNIDKNISIIENSIIELKKEEILDNIFENLYQEKNELFLKLINDFCVKDDKEIKKCILNVFKKLELKYDLDDYLNNYVNNYYNDTFIDKRINEYEKLLFDKISKLNSLFLEIEEYVDIEYYNEINDSIGELLISKNYDDIKSNLKPLPRLKKNMDDAKVLKNKMDDIIKELQILCDYQNIDIIKSSIYNTLDYVEIIVYILKIFNEQVFKYKSELNLYEFIDIEKLAIKILKENEEIRNNIKYSLNEIMIDEYQDTNDLQDLFISLIQNNNVYMVGDIKQSIYRFRNANPNIFKEKYDKYSSNIDGIKIDLNKNFRSRKEVLYNINEIFNVIMSDDIGGADYKKSHQMIFGNNMYNDNSQNNNLEIYSYEENSFLKEEVEAFIIANDIKEKIKNNYKVIDSETKELRNINYNDIVILVDKTTKFDLYKKIFEYLNVPLTLYKDEVLTDNIDINLFKNIINLIINKKHDKKFKYSFLSICRSYLFKMEDNEIFKYFLNGNYDESELMKIINKIDYKNKTIKELLLEIIDIFNFYEKLILVGNIDSHIVSFEYLINLSDCLTKMGYTIKDFYNYLETLIDSDYKIKYTINNNSNGVKIMTIHKSKGLEFNLCYYCGIYSKFNISELKEKIIFDDLLIVPYIDNGIRNTIYKELLKNKYMKDEISEKIRLFYVALTRSKEKMIIVTPKLDKDKKERLDYTSFYDIINSIKDDLSKYIKDVDIDKLNLTKKYNYIKSNNYNENINKCDEIINVNEINLNSEEINSSRFSKTTNKLFTKTEIKNMEYGNHLHSLLETIDFINPDYKNINDFDKSKIQKFLENDIFKDVINIYKEYEFIFEEDNNLKHGFIDLLLESKDEFKIVDYKTKNIEDIDYLKQLEGYKKYIESISEKSVKIYLYSILDNELKEL